MEDVLYETARYMAEAGPYGDDYASNLAFNVSAATTAAASLGVDVAKSTDRGQKYAERAVEAFEDTPLEALGITNDSYLTRAGAGGIYGGLNGLAMDSPAGMPDVQDSGITSAMVTGGTAGTLLETGFRDAVVTIGNFLERDSD